MPMRAASVISSPSVMRQGGAAGLAGLGAVGTEIGNKTSFDARNYGYASLSKLLAATQAFEFRDEGTSRVAVRDKRAARAPAPLVGGPAST